MLQGQQLFNDVLKEVENWNPTKEYNHESKFQNELKEVLDKQLNSEGRGIMGRQKDIPVDRERGKSNADLAVDDTVGIEMKRNLSNSQVDRLSGQIDKYLNEYPFVIICACGIEDKSGWRRLKNKFQGSQGIEGGQVEFIWKKKENYGKSQQGDDSGEGDMFGEPLF
ncbi:MAG: hypothetical protein MUP63_02820 [Candidatus Nanohaloarchaeota archaeon QJJ-7]|nr:hypothetical protein [Candidatus Nanohaloarchaeota archaeon QJJ-7]